MARRGAAELGFTYIGLLFAVAVIGLMLSAVGVVWHTEAQREREKELLFIGHEFRAAIRSYYTSQSGGGPRYPQRLEDLLQDDRGTEPKHHLRKLYLDPMTGAADWALEKIDGVGITAIASSSQGTPIKRDGFTAADQDFLDKDCYCDWKFGFIPGRRTRRAVTPAVSPAVTP
jgi:type II secretory pathway pseudopilin PulG